LGLAYSASLGGMMSLVGSLTNMIIAADTWIILVSSALFILFDLIEWHHIEENTQWGILLLSGGGMALSNILQTSGAGEWIAHAVIDKAVANKPVLFVMVTVLFLIFITEMMSNAAAAAMSMPILIITASTLHFPPVLLAPLVGVTVSMAFMFPIATPPNAIVYGTGLIPLKKMISTGFMLNLLGAIFIMAYVFLYK
jgi:sodium-dependent dicarboxylate transporter 2/3/5